MPICGHGNCVGDLAMGSEEGIKTVIRNGVRYIGHVEYGSCSKCNAASDKRIEEQISAIEVANREKSHKVEPPQGRVD
jgi:hypothetical protein